MFQQVLSPQGTWSSGVQYSYINVSSALATGGGYVAVPTVIYNGLGYYATNSFPTKGSNPVANSAQWQPLAGIGNGTVTSVTSANADIAVATGTTTPQLTLNSATAATASTIVKRGTDSSVTASGLNLPTAANSASGTGVLVAGTVTISNTFVTANSKIFLQAGAVNSSTALGSLRVIAITPGVSFQVDSRQQATPGSVQTGDLSTFTFMAINNV